MPPDPQGQPPPAGTAAAGLLEPDLEAALAHLGRTWHMPAWGPWAALRVHLVRAREVIFQLRGGPAPIERIRERLVAGRAEHGLLDIEADRRDFLREIEEEIDDGLAYYAMEDERRRRLRLRHHLEAP